MYTANEMANIRLGALGASANFVSLAIQKDDIGCDSSKAWTLAFHIGEIIETIDRADTDTLTALNENHLYERLIYFRNVNV